MEKCNVLRANLIIDKKFNIISAESSFYQLVNDAEMKNCYKIFCDDDIPSILNAFDNCKERCVTCFATVLAREEKKKCIIDIAYNNEKTFKMIIYDAMMIKESFTKNDIEMQRRDKVNKYINCFYYEFFINEKVVYVSNYCREESTIKLTFDEFYKYLKTNFKLVDEVSTLSKAFMRKNMFSEEKVFEYSTKEGQKFIITKSPVLNQYNEVISFVGILNQHEHITHETENPNMDKLTNTLNKLTITEYGTQRINNKEKTTLIIFDVDHFKDFNDNYGHFFGDQVLKNVARIIKKYVPKEIGKVGRFGGDEFLAIIDYTEEEQIREVARNIRLGIQWLYAKEKMETPLTVSMGICSYPKDGDNYDDLFKIADKSLYIAKNRGQNRYIIYDKVKHGDIIIDKNASKIVKEENISRNFEKQAEVFAKCFERKEGWLNESCEILAKALSMSRINIYLGEKLKLYYSFGGMAKATNLDGDYILNKQYLSDFNNDGILTVDNYTIYETKNKEIQDEVLKRETKSFIQYLFKKDGKIFGCISFEVCFITRTWEKFEINFLCIFASIIKNAVQKDENGSFYL